jgi:hypothetical protein
VQKSLDQHAKHDSTAAAEHVTPVDGRLLMHAAIAAARDNLLLTPLLRRERVNFTTYDNGSK